MSSFSQSQVKALELLASGFTNAEIAKELSLSENYVCGGRNGFLGRIYSQLFLPVGMAPAHCLRAQAVAAAMRKGIIK